MAFKLNRKSATAADSPEALFRDLRNRQVPGLLSHQADMLRQYQQRAIESANVALQLPTGSGKTLVGLLIGEWRRRSFQEKVVYLCPTKQLVHQVVDQSVSKYGIRAHAFTGSQANFAPVSKAEYASAETLAVTTYSGLFNTNPYFSDADILILDDAHAVENYIAGHWSLLITRAEHQALYEGIVSLMRPYLRGPEFIRLLRPTKNTWDTQWVDKLPTPHLAEIETELTALLDQHSPDTKLRYSWSVLRDHLHACQLYTSVTSILIRPAIPPTLTHEPFSQPKQRLYMSATLGEGGDLERLTGVRQIDRLPIPPGWDKQGIGRRLFFFPERSMPEKQALDLTIEMVKKSPRALVIVPDDNSVAEFAEVVVKAGYKVFSAAQIEESKDEFVSTKKAVAVKSNRYDGIDMLNDQCRLLVIQGLPRATNLQERFLVSRLAATVLLNDRILTRIVQAVGRCTRSPTDYAAVVILGEELNKYLSDPKRRSFLHPEVQAELEFGLEQSKGAKSLDFLDNLVIFNDHKREWDQADEAIIAVRAEMQQSRLPAMEKLMDSAAKEVDFQYALWKADFELAVEKSQAVLSALSGDDVKGYRAFWNYLCGSAAWLGAQRGNASLKAVARDQFKRASAGTASIRWLIDLAKLDSAAAVSPEDDRHLATVVEGLEVQLESHGTANDRKFEAEISEILSGLQLDDAKPFEVAHARLGSFLGFEAGRRDVHGAPDCWWSVSDELCIVFEDHSDPQPGCILGATKVRQAASHPDWVRHHLQLSSTAKIFAVLVTPAKKMDDSAAPHVSDVLAWSLDSFREWAKLAISTVREQRRTFPGAGDIEWRQAAMNGYKAANIDPTSLLKFLGRMPLAKMPVSKS